MTRAYKFHICPSLQNYSKPEMPLKEQNKLQVKTFIYIYPLTDRFS